MAKVKFKRRTTAEINELEVEDGALIYNTDNGKTYMDFEEERIQTGGNADTIISTETTEPTDEDIKLWINPDKMVKSPSNIIDIAYPVGSYYETSDTTFNPNTTWGGTWELEEDGTVLVSNSSTSGSIFNDTIGTTVGEETHTLTVEEMPSHQHGEYLNNTSGSKYAYSLSNGGGETMSGNFISSNVFGGVTGQQVLTSATGGDQPHNIVQPSKIVNRWHRTA